MSAEHDHHHADDDSDVEAGDPKDVVDGLTRVLAHACRALADAGQPRAAGKLAADGWVLLRESHERQAERLDGTMHYTARLEAQQKE
ncbi:hypothetical protein [Parafrigoribacterium soli]|uniref:hypothetical protein n=1 Tax=Parafrigoribacterium soli TaxID=3144663 RepID=UPI0032EE9A72